MSEPTRFKVALEFEVDINPISVPDADTFAGLGAKKQPPKEMSEAKWRKALEAKGMSEADIEKALAEIKKAGKGAAAKGGKGKPQGQDYQMLLYPEYESWAAAQEKVQQEILKDETLSIDYVREILRDLTRGQIDALIDDKYGTPDLNGVLKVAMQRIPAGDQGRLHAAEESLLHDETELVDDSVDFRFSGLSISKI